MLLVEINLFAKSFKRSPLFDPTLQRTKLSVAETARIFALQPFKQGFGLESID